LSLPRRAMTCLWCRRRGEGGPRSQGKLGARPVGCKSRQRASLPQASGTVSGRAPRPETRLRVQATREQAVKAAKEQVAAREQAAREQAARNAEARERAPREQAARERAARERTTRWQAARDEAAKRAAAQRPPSARRKAAKTPRSNSIRGLFTASRPKTRCHRRERIPFLRASQGQKHRAFQQSALAAKPAPEAGPSYLSRTSPISTNRPAQNSL
jgi:hypothetical protein